jgi:hypothetical protein
LLFLVALRLWIWVRALLIFDRYTTVNPPPGSLEYARQARRMVDIDQPSIENLQTLLLLSQTFYAYGCGKKAYMTLGASIASLCEAC